MITLNQVRRNKNLFYKVSKIENDTVHCNFRNGPSGRFTNSSIKIKNSIFEKYELISKENTTEKVETHKEFSITPDVTKEFQIKLLKKENEKLRTKLLQHVSGHETIMSTVREILENNPLELDIPPLHFEADKDQEEIAVLHISDIHVGKITDSYDSSVAEIRMIELINRTIKITNMRRSAASIKEIRVYLGGDIIEGEEIFSHQPHIIDQSVYDQSIITGPKILLQCLVMLLANFTKVKIVCVAGNHGRNGHKKNASHPRTNWDNVCYSTTKLMLDSATPKEDKNRYEFIISDKFFAIDRVYDFQNLMVHGHEITGGFGGVPWYGVSKRAYGWIDSIGEPWDYLYFGHFHTYAGPIVLNHRIYMANGTTETDNDYARANLAAAGHPCQRLGFFNKKHGMISDNQIFLIDRNPKLIEGRMK